MTPCIRSRKAIEKIPAESGPRMIGVSDTCQVSPRSEEWKTRAALPPVANQMSGAEAPLFHACAGGGVVVPASRAAADSRFLVASLLGMTRVEVALAI